MVKEVKDYVEAVLKKFPYLTNSEINKILTYGLKRYAYANKMHCDVLLCNRIDEPINIYSGRLGYDTFKHYLRWVTKYRLKERVLFRLYKKKWDGYYYIGLDNKDHEKIRKSKNKHFTNVYLTKIKKELYHNKIVKHIWRVPWPLDCGWKFFLEKLTTDKAEYVGKNKFEEYHDCFQGKFKDLWKAQ